jgi:clan AA aspartic protease (TIGR02281 family)
MMKYDFALERRKITVKAVINGLREVELILDTGAGTTVLKEQTAIALGYNPRTIATGESFVSAGGRVNAKILKLDRFEAFGKEVKNFKVAIMPLPLQMLADGLLGVDFLQMLRKFSINFDDRQIELDD